jgi:hypothetical protein
MNAIAVAVQDHLPGREVEVSLGSGETSLAFPSVIPADTQDQLLRMFRDPYVLDSVDRLELIARLREAAALVPAMSEMRVLLGMALCVNFEAQEALDELRESVRLAPESFIAHLKFGELLMRLRICDQAVEQTQMAAQLANTPLQSELARRQAATIRAMQREGIERGGYGKLLNIFARTQQVLARIPARIPFVRRRAALQA